MLYRVLVCGDRNMNAAENAINAAFTPVLEKHGTNVLIIEGAGGKVDTAAGELADALGVAHLRIPAQWTRYGRAAGPVRNRAMLDEGAPHVVLAFHDYLPRSKGTKDMVTQAQQRGIAVHVYDSNGKEVNSWQ